jgi:hypothetical protein
MRVACLLGLLVATWVTFSQKTNALGLGTEVFIFTLGFGFIPDLVDGHGEGQQESGRLSKLEEEIRDLLNDLGDDFHVLQDIESPHGTIRQVVFSRGAGVFLIEARPDLSHAALDHSSPACERHGPEPHVIDQCTAKAYWLRDRITEIVGVKPWISSLLVMPNAFVPHDLKVDGVRIINKASLVSALSENGGRRRKSNLLWDARRLIADSLAG